jgi:protein AbiQ
MQRPIIVQLNGKYFNEDNELVINQPIPEALKKRERPYVEGTLIADDNNTYFVPFRSKLNSKLVREFPELVLELPTANKPQAGLDLTKLLVVRNDINFKVSRGYINYDQYKELTKRQEELLTKIENFVSGYKKEVSRGEPLNSQYRYTTLKYFHKELGLDAIKIHESKRLNEARKIIKTIYAHDATSNDAIKYLSNSEIPISQRLKVADKIIAAQKSQTKLIHKKKSLER